MNGDRNLPPPQRASRKGAWWLFIGGAVFIGFVVIAAVSGQQERGGGVTRSGGGSGGSQSASTRLVDECRTAERIIQRNLNDPGSVEWSGNCWLAGSGRSGYSKIGDTWYIRFRARNGFGGMVMTTCRVEVNGAQLTLRGC